MQLRQELPVSPAMHQSGTRNALAMPQQCHSHALALYGVSSYDRHEPASLSSDRSCQSLPAALPPCTSHGTAMRQPCNQPPCAFHPLALCEPAATTAATTAAPAALPPCGICAKTKVTTWMECIKYLNNLKEKEVFSRKMHSNQLQDRAIHLFHNNHTNFTFLSVRGN